MARPKSKSDEEVMAATMRAVSAHGVSALTLAHVAKEAGLSPSTLVERYGSKRALLLEAARSGISTADKVEVESPIDYLVALAGSIGDRRAFAHHLAFLELDVADPEFREAAADHVAAVLARLESFGLSAREARALYVAYNGALVLWALTGEGSLEDSLRADLSHSPEPGGASTSPSA
jgi:AcrR family transcriptional regulator